ncbi:hypothetical protein NC651_026138 [Populus alba x Populus x berolinensis]|nr:hypothetical protein NC651_026138 [Populus alba x Populus x berolinensis]
MPLSGMILFTVLCDGSLQNNNSGCLRCWYQLSCQQETYSTKTISEVSGTGRKPYRQKRTGQARYGTLHWPQILVPCMWGMSHQTKDGENIHGW